MVRRVVVWCFALASACFTILGIRASAQEPINPAVADTLTLLRSSSTEDRVRALGIIQQFSFVRNDPQIHQSLTSELRRTNQLQLERLAQVRIGGTTSNEVAANYRLRLIETVIALRDPAAIPDLCRAVDVGQRVERAVAAFGEAAVPAIRAVWDESYTTTPSLGIGLHRSGLVRTLALIATKSTISPTTRDWLVDFDRQLLNVPSDWLIIEAGIDLAVSLNHPELMGRVRAIASDVNQVIALGVATPEDAQHVQKHAISRLSQL